MTIYFIRAVDCGRIKIGYTDSPTPDGRLSSMQTGCPSDLEVLAFGEGTEEREGELHRILDRSRIRGEWFKPTEKLASLIAYVKLAKTTVGWEKSEVDPGSWTTFFARYKRARRPEWEDLDDAELRWRIAIETAQFNLPPLKIRLEWSSINTTRFSDGENLGLGVEHRTHGNEFIDSSFGWKDRRDDLLMNKGQQLTAKLLACARSRDEEAAIWVAACIHELLTDSRYVPTMGMDRLPDIMELRAAVAEVIDGRLWGPKMTCPLPLNFRMPEHCLVTVGEFVDLVASHRLATLCRYTPYAEWRHGAFCKIEQRRQEAA